MLSLIGMRVILNTLLLLCGDLEQNPIVSYGFVSSELVNVFACFNLPDYIVSCEIIFIYVVI